MRLLPRAARIAEGEVRFNGHDLLQLNEQSMRRLRGREIGMIFQEPMTSLNPVYSVGWQIAEVLRQHEGLSARSARLRAVELLDTVRIPDPQRRVDDFPHQLSGGMRQRVMIAMAIACSPRLLIADEPTTALDVTIQAQVLDLLDRLRKELSMGLILITHDLGVVSQWADRVVVMYAGREVEQASPGPLFEHPCIPIPGVCWLHRRGCSPERIIRTAPERNSRQYRLGHRPARLCLRPALPAHPGLLPHRRAATDGCRTKAPQCLPVTLPAAATQNANFS